MAQELGNNFVIPFDRCMLAKQLDGALTVESPEGTAGGLLMPEAAPFINALGSREGNTLITAGDSFAANGFGVVGNNFISRQTEGAFNWFDWLLGGAFNYLGNVGVGGQTCRQMIDLWFPTIIAQKPKYVWFTAGHNDIYVDQVSEFIVAARIIEAITKLLDNGIVPIWSTVWHRSFSANFTDEHMRLNDLLRNFAYTSGSTSLFYDGAAITMDNSSSNTNNEGRLPLANWFYDASIHPNNRLSMHIGQWAFKSVGSRILQYMPDTVGNETVAIAANGSNLLVNPGFLGGTAVASANCTGTMPDGWTIDWATRTGTGSAAAALVDVLDPTTGLAIARAVEVTISGAPAAGDILRISQSNSTNPALASSLNTGNKMQAEGIVSLTSGANVSRIDMRVQANSNESTWCGIPRETPVALPATVPPLTYRTFPITVLGAGVANQARYDCRMHFIGNGAGSVLRFWKPRVRKIV